MRIDNDNGLGELIQSTEETRVCTGFTFAEGPIWIPEDNCLLFSDIRGNTIHRWRPGSEEAEVYRHPSRHSNGMTLDHDGNLLVCEHSGRQVTRSPYNGEPETVVDTYDDKRLNSPNDIVVSRTSAIYFTDPNSGLTNPGMGEEGAEQELDFLGVYRVATNGMLQLMVTDLGRPNGLAFSPNESLMYINDSAANKVQRYTVFADGALSSSGELFFDMSEDPGDGVVDGMKVDEDGRVWTTGPGGIWVIDKDGNLLGRLALDEKVTNLNWGGSDFSTIYATTPSSVFAIETTVRGVAPGSR